MPLIFISLVSLVVHCTCFHRSYRRRSSCGYNRTNQTLHLLHQTSELAIRISHSPAYTQLSATSRRTARESNVEAWASVHCGGLFSGAGTANRDSICQSTAEPEPTQKCLQTCTIGDLKHTCASFNQMITALWSTSGQRDTPEIHMLPDSQRNLHLSLGGPLTHPKRGGAVRAQQCQADGKLQHPACCESRIQGHLASQTLLFMPANSIANHVLRRQSCAVRLSVRLSVI